MATIRSLNQNNQSEVSPEFLRTVKKKFGLENYPDKYFRVKLEPQLNNLEAKVTIEINQEEVNQDIEGYKNAIEDLRRLKQTGNRQASIPQQVS